MGSSVHKMNLNIPEPCASCGGKCCNRFAVPITHLDVLRLSKRTGKEPIEFCKLEDSQNISKNPYPKVFVENEDGKLVEKMLVLKRNKNEWCIFFARSNGCTAHLGRPVVCKTYPFSLFSEFAKEKGIGSKKLERILQAFAPKAKSEDISGEKADGEVYYTMNTACPRRWEKEEFSIEEVMRDLKVQEEQLKEYWKVANEWNAKRRKEVKPDFGEFLEFAVEKAQES